MFYKNGRHLLIHSFIHSANIQQAPAMCQASTMPLLGAGHRARLAGGWDPSKRGLAAQGRCALLRSQEAGRPSAEGRTGLPYLIWGPKSE